MSSESPPLTLLYNFSVCYALPMPSQPSNHSHQPASQPAGRSDHGPSSSNAPRPAAPRSLLSLDLSAAEELVAGLGWPGYRAQQILRWLYQRRVHDVGQMTDLSKAERATLQRLAVVGRAQDCRALRSEDGTRKFLIRLEDGLTVESVLIPDRGRLTLCLSTQVGCTLDCGFCLTGQMGLKRNLKAHEIVDQVLTVQDRLEQGESLSSLVLMGMGEPLANVGAVTEALARVTDESWGLGISPRRITLSTAGLASRLPEAAALGVNLAISLNATTDEQRTALMPAVNRLHPLNHLLSACRELYPAQRTAAKRGRAGSMDSVPQPDHRRRLTFEYVLLAGVNDQEADARRLPKLLQGIRCKVNLIPFNPYPGSPYRRPSDAAVLRFQAIVKHKGLEVFIRKSKGRDVLGACGQLGDLPALITPKTAASSLTLEVGA
jgi:23S rRNA (adenine2503-C2)-methyltransferase